MRQDCKRAVRSDKNMYKEEDSTEEPIHTKQQGLQLSRECLPGPTQALRLQLRLLSLGAH